MEDDDACTRKQLREALLEWILFKEIIIGMNESIFNSIPIHTPIQLEEEIDISELIINIIANKMFRLFRINKGFGKLHYGVKAQKILILQEYLDYIM